MPAESSAGIRELAVAVIDILGMKRLLQTKTLHQIAHEVMEPFTDITVEDALPTVKLEKADLTEETLVQKFGFVKLEGVYHAFISDTLVLWHPPTPEAGHTPSDAIHQLSTTVGRIIGFNTARRIYLRGAIAYGPCLLTTGEHFILLGNAVHEAFLWEKSQQWVGAMLAPSAAQTWLAPDPSYADHPDMDTRFARYEVPLKPGVKPPQPMIAIDWTQCCLLALRGYRCPRQLRAAKQEPDIAEKIRNTQAFVREMQRRRKVRAARR